MKDIQIVYEFESLFPKGDPDLEFYTQFKEQFEPDDNTYIVGIVEQDGFFEEDKLKAFKALEDSLKRHPSILEGISPVSFELPVKSPFGFVTVPAIHIDEPERYHNDSLKMMQDPLLNGRLVSSDGKGFLMLLKTIDPISQDQAENLHDFVQEKLEKSQFKKFHTMGRAPIQTEFVRFQLKEMFVYTLAALLIVIVVLWLVFRKPVPVALAVLTVGLALVIFLGSIGFFGIKLDFISALFPILMLIVGMSDVIHILSKYLEELEKGFQKELALKTTIREIGMATFLTSATTAIGFLSLLSSKIVPIQHFGLTAAYGVLLAYVLSILFVPASLMLFDGKSLLSNKNILNRLEPFLEKIHQQCQKGSLKIIGATVVFTLVFIFGTSQINPQGKLKNDLPQDQKITYDYEYFESVFGGFRPFEIALMPKEGYSFKDIEVVNEVAKLEAHLIADTIYHSMFSPNDIYRGIGRARSSNKFERFEVPKDQNELNQFLKDLKKAPGNTFNSILSEDFKDGRLTAKMPDIGSMNAEIKFENLRKWIAENINQSVLDLRITGSSILFDNNHKYLVESLFKGLFAAFLIVSLLMTILFKSWKMVFISLIPNMLPLLATGAFLGLTGIALDATSSIIFTISFGIAVDDTIHFLSRYKLEQNRGTGLEESIRRSLLISGKAIVLTTIVLLAGFLILTSSKLSGTFKVGLLTSLTLASALIADLYLIPVLIRLFYRKKNQGSTSK